MISSNNSYLGLDPLFIGISTFVDYLMTKAIVVGLGDKGVHIFPAGISPKYNRVT